MHLVDLHTHSHYSDGTSSPEEILKNAASKKIKAISLTDHDTIDGIPQARKESLKLNIPFISGVEISNNKYDHLHILGYNIDEKNPNLINFLNECRKRRKDRVLRIIKMLNNAGVNITEKDLPIKENCAVGRAHIADALRLKGFVSTRQEAFRKYLIPGRTAYVLPAGVSVKEAISIIKQAGGISVLAHPGVIMQHLNFPAWVESGLMGIEVFYPAHTPSDILKLMEFSKKYGLFITAGSDYHGPASGREKQIGMQVPDDIFYHISRNFLT